jgi:branched-chain amino acid transport system substrate-binding protein
MKNLCKFFKMSFVLALLSVLMTFGPVAANAAPVAANAPKIKIGILGPMTYHFGRWMWNAATLTSEEINESGGINIKGTKYQIELVKIDTNEIVSVPDSVSAMERAITMEKCDFVMGGARSEAVFAMQEVAADHKKIFFDMTASPRQVERLKKDYPRYKYYFRTSMIAIPELWAFSVADAEYVAQMVKKKLVLKQVKVAIIIDKAAYAEGWPEFAKDIFIKSGYEVVGIWRPGYTSTDLYSEANAIKASGAQLIYAVLSGPGGPAFVNAWGKLKIPAALTGTITAAQELSFWKDSGGSANYLTAYDSIGRVGMTSRTIPYYDRYFKKFGAKPGWSSGHMDGAVLALRAALERAGSLDADEVVKALEKTDLIAANGRIKFLGLDSKYPHQTDDSLRTMVSFQWKEGKMNWYFPPRVKYTVPSALVEANPQLGDLGKFRYEGITDFELPPWMLPKN